MTSCNHYGQNIRAARKALGLSQKDFAKLCRMSPTHISHIETGNRDPSFRTANKIKDALAGADKPQTSLVPTEVESILAAYEKLTANNRHIIYELMLALARGSDREE